MQLKYTVMEGYIINTNSNQYENTKITEYSQLNIQQKP